MKIHTFGRNLKRSRRFWKAFWALLILSSLAALPVGADWRAEWHSGSTIVEYRHYNDDFVLEASFSNDIPDMYEGERRWFATEVWRYGSLNKDHVVVQHMSFAGPLDIVSTITYTSGAASCLFTSGGPDYMHFAARFLYEGSGWSKSAAKIEALDTGDAAAYTNIVVWEYGGDPWEAPQPPVHTLLEKRKTFDVN